jgi:hypothetical protein
MEELLTVQHKQVANEIICLNLKELTKKQDSGHTWEGGPNLFVPYGLAATG